MKYFWLLLISTGLYSQSGVYDGLNVGFDEDSNTLTAVFDLSDYHANGTVDRCQLYVVASKIQVKSTLRLRFTILIINCLAMEVSPISRICTNTILSWKRKFNNVTVS